MSPHDYASVQTRLEKRRCVWCGAVALDEELDADGACLDRRGCLENSTPELTPHVCLCLGPCDCEGCARKAVES